MRRAREPAAASGISDEQYHEIVHDAMLTGCIMLAVVAPMVVLERARRVDNKAVSYAMSLTCALSMTLTGFLVAMPEIYDRGLDIPVLLHHTRADRFICTFFGTYCVFDLAVGMVVYPKQVDLLTGWVHHGAYLGLMAYLHYFHIAGGFLIFLVEELPTFLLALGNVSRPLRTNLLFGITFLTTRILWHGFALERFWASRNKTHLTLWPFVAVTMMLHLHWFYGFMRQQVRRSQRARHVRKLKKA
mmetsp:Transcript_16523/g.48113  ORF Transcript_16523/g.48113 Transcript_16523/m.48113 type:complete len:245 (-) Transcript_16523:382-1116(-)